MTPEREAEIRKGIWLSQPVVAELFREIDRLRAELASVRAEREWRPIETAPKDGTRILTYSSTGVYVCFGWSIETNGWESITHWMPIPPDPKDEWIQPLSPEKVDTETVEWINKISEARS